MKYPFFSAFHLPASAWLLVFIVNLLLSFFIAYRIKRNRNGRFLFSLLICLLLTVVVGYIIIMFYRAIKHRQTLYNDLNERISHPCSLKDELLRLKMFKQAGMISKEEYEEEKKRIVSIKKMSRIREVSIYKGNGLYSI